MSRKIVVPKAGNCTQIVIPSRVSSVREGKQDERSTRDQRKEILRRLGDYVGDQPYEVTSKEWSGSGEFIERREFLELIAMIETGKFDLLIVEDLGRILRRIKVFDFCELCVKYGTRVVAIGDYVDTAEDGWQECVIMVGMHHERSGRDSSGRIKRGLNGRFADGGCAAFNIVGYIKPADAKTDADWRKDPACEPIYEEWFQRLEDGQSYLEVADWLNSIHAPTGRFCKNKVWDGKTIDKLLNDAEVVAMKAWIRENAECAGHPVFGEVIARIHGITETAVADEEARADLLWFCETFNNGEEPLDHGTAATQVLHGMMAGIAADNVVTLDEVQGLMDWLGHRPHPPCR